LFESVNVPSKSNAKILRDIKNLIPINVKKQSLRFALHNATVQAFSYKIKIVIKFELCSNLQYT